MDCSPRGSSIHGILQARILEWVAIPFPRDLPDLGIKPRSPALQADSLPPEPPGKPKNTRVVAYPSPGDLPYSGIKPGLIEVQADTLPAELPGKPTYCYGLL